MPLLCSFWLRLGLGLEERTVLFAVLYAFISSVRCARRNWPCRRVRRGYAGSPLTRIGALVEEKANRPKSFRSPKSASIAASCLHPFEKYHKRFILEQIIFNKENLLSLRHPLLLPYFDKTTPYNFNRPCRADRCRKVKKNYQLEDIIWI